MKSSEETESSVIGVGHLMEVISGLRPETYPFQRYVALLTFSTWLGWPSDPHVVEMAETVAVARLLLAIDRGEIQVQKSQRNKIIQEVSRQAFKPLRVATALAEPCLETRFRDASAEFNLPLWNVTAVAAFFLQCPEKLKPSVNKALFFISEGGFRDSITIERRGRKLPYKVSSATLRNSWSRLAVSSPFAFAAVTSSLENIFKLAPDGEQSIAEAKTLLRKSAVLRRYFENARHVQDTLLPRLDKTTRDKYEFVTFPTSISPSAQEFAQLGDDQQAIVKRYKAPMFLPEEEAPTAPVRRPSNPDRVS
jgi:hypothetical protein